MTLTRIMFVGGFACLAIYLLVSAPEPLPDGDMRAAGCRHPVNAMFDGVNAINQVARGIYTKRIVGGGLAAGLKFGEDWQEPGVEQGPLPALFLRATAAHLETLPPRLGLFLGSDAPINKSNLIGEAQKAVFSEVKSTRVAAYSEDTQIGFVAMYPDVAGVAPCVTCHNDHVDSPKKDWKLNDVMGATTWTYPEAEVSADQFFAVVDAVYTSVAHTYGAYLDKTADFAQPVAIGDAWPSTTQRVLPTTEAFLEEVRQQAAPALVQAMMHDRQPPSSQMAVQASRGDVSCGF